jgi:hypothetical protein
VRAIERARELAEAQGVRNATFEQADAQVHPLSARILEAAGFADVTFTDVREPMYFGPDVATALDWIRGFACTREALNRLDPAAAARALRLDSRAWIVTARR